MRKLLKKHGRVPRVLVTDKLQSYAAANRDLGLDLDHRQHKGLNNLAENSHQPTCVREKVMRRLKSARHLQRFASTHDQVANLLIRSRCDRDAAAKRSARVQSFANWAWERASGARLFDVVAMRRSLM